MKIDVQQAGTCRVNVIVEAEAGEIDPALRRVRAKYQQGVALPGFRKGHAPWERVEAIYGKAVKDDCDQSVMGTLYAAAREELKKGGREVAALANVEKLEYALGKGAQVTLAIDIDPTFDLPDISKWQVRKAEVAATEAEIDEGVERMRTSGSSFQDLAEAGTAVERTDLVSVGYTSDLSEAGVASPFVAREEFWFCPESGSFVPGLGDAVAGKTVGETFAHEATYPADFRNEDVAGKTVRYTVTIKRIRRPERLDDAKLCAQANVADMGELRKRVAADLCNTKQFIEGHRVGEDLRKAILASVDFDLPETPLNRLVYDNLASDPEKPLETFAGKADELRASPAYAKARQQATDQLRLQYTLLRVAHDRKVTLAQEEFDAALARLAGNVGMDVKTLLRRLNENGRLSEFLERTLTEKVFGQLTTECATL